MNRVIRAAYLGKNIGDITSIEDQNTVEKIKNAL